MDAGEKELLVDTSIGRVQLSLMELIERAQLWGTTGQQKREIERLEGQLRKLRRVHCAETT